MDKRTKTLYKQSKKRERIYYNKKAIALAYGEEYVQSLICIPKMSFIGIIKLIPVFMLSQILAVIVELCYYIYLAERKIISIKNPSAVYLTDKMWNSSMDKWLGFIHQAMISAAALDMLIGVEIKDRQKVLSGK